MCIPNFLVPYKSTAPFIDEQQNRRVQMFLFCFGFFLIECNQYVILNFICCKILNGTKSIAEMYNFEPTVPSTDWMVPYFQKAMELRK